MPRHGPTKGNEHRMKNTARAAALAAGALLLTLTAPAGASAAPAQPQPRVDLRVLLVSDGGPAVEAVRAELDAQGTPYTRVDLNSAGRPVLTAAFLADSVGGRPRAKFQAVVLPDANPFGSGSPELAALAAYEQRYGIPQVDAYTWANPEAGLGYPEPGDSRSLDGVQAAVTEAGRSGPFGYLRGAVPFEDNSPSVSESYGFLAAPAPGADFTPYVDAPLAGGGRGSLVGEYRHDGRRELVVTFAYNQYQQQFRLLARGIVDWMTQGIHLGASRHHFTVHVDDVFAADDRWDSALNCTPGDIDCAGGGGEPDPIRMTAEDAAYARSWSREHGLTLDLVYNGAGSDQYREQEGGDPLADRLLADRADYRWVNHTYEHPFLGCVQDVSAVPWKCATDASGAVRYVPRSEISQQISENRRWGQKAKLPLNEKELVTGEHSGLKVLPQQPADNPNLAPALAENGIGWLGSDNSREPAQRSAGSARTVPRYPMNIFYNVGRAEEQVDEYNWIYTRRADGGSGVCETSPVTTCLDAPLDTATGYRDRIVPLESALALGHVLSGDVRPHFIHQSNLAEDRIAYPVLEKVLSSYASLFAANTPLVNPRMADTGEELRKRAAFQDAVRANKVTAYRVGETITVQTPAGVETLATMPAGTRQNLLLGSTPFGSAYAGRLGGWVSPALLQGQVSLNVPNAPLAPAATASRAQLPAEVRKLPVPQGVRKQAAPGPVRQAPPSRGR